MRNQAFGWHQLELLRYHDKAQEFKRIGVRFVRFHRICSLEN